MRRLLKPRFFRKLCRLALQYGYSAPAENDASAIA